MKIFNFLKSSKPMCGLDLGSSWAKTVKLASKGKSVSLAGFARLPWSYKDLESTSAQGGKVKTLWEHLGLKDKVVISSMAGHAVIVKRVFLNAGTSKDLEQTIFKEARQYIPFDLNDVYLDYQLLGQGSRQDTREVMLVASKKKVVQELLKLVDQSGLSLGIVDVDAFALSNCFEFNYPELAHEPAYLLDIGGMQSVFTIFWRNQPVFFREMSFGGRQLTDAIAQNFDTGRLEAEKLKIEGPGSLDNSLSLDISKEIAGIIRSWADEIKRLISFYQTSVPDAGQAQKVFLSGGGSLFKGIDSLFQKELKIETRHMDPWKNIQTSINDYDFKYLETVKPQFAVATGLALRSII